MTVSVLVVAAALVLVSWCVVLADRPRAWPRALLLEGGGDGGRAPSDTVVVVPARNEAQTIGETLPSLLGQKDSFSRLYVVDDGSTDDTARLAREAAEQSAASDHTEVIECPTTPGWSGKLRALDAGVRRAVRDVEAGGRMWFLFTDADIRHPASSVRMLRDIAEKGPYDLVSVMVQLRAASFWERLLIPPFVYFFQLLYPFRRVADPRSRVAAAAGGCVLLRASVLEEIGGLAAIRGAVIDDVALARRAKDTGARLWLGLSRRMRSLRAYDGLSEIAHMVSRTAFTQLRHSYLLLLVTAAAMLAFLVLPPVLFGVGVALGVAGETRGVVVACLGGAAWLCQCLSFLPAVRHHDVRGVFAATLPFASLLYLWMTLRSAWLHLRGTAVRWRGRAIDGFKSRA